MKRTKLFKAAQLFLVATFVLGQLGCSKIEKAVDDYLTGIFKSDDGWVIELKETAGKWDGIVTAAGQPRGSLSVGDKIIKGAIKQSDNKLEGLVINDDMVTYKNGTVYGYSDKITVTPDGGQTQIYKNTKTTSSGSSGSGSSGKSDTLINVAISGDMHQSMTYSFTLPSGMKYMKIIARDSMTSAYAWNYADMFVRLGSAPVFDPNTYAATSKWTADCASILPNHDDEVCTFTNPSAGKWYVTLYGYNHSFQSVLVVIAN